MVGRNYGLSGPRLIGKILIPAAFPSILTGLKIGWAFAWRTLIAAELVFGVNGDAGGLGWFIFERKNTMDTPAVFAGLLMVILILVFAFGRASYGMEEEALAFYPILVPLFLAAGYDLLVPLAIIFGGNSVGGIAAFSNPFSNIRSIISIESANNFD